MHDGRNGTRGRLAAGLALGLALALGAAEARAGDGVQFSSDCQRTYVNKQVGDTEQWAITWEIYGDATGNVFKLDGSPPSFIECIFMDETAETEIFDCFGSSPCAGPPCGGDQWQLISQGLEIPLSFFLPPGVDIDDPIGACLERP